MEGAIIWFHFPSRPMQPARPRSEPFYPLQTSPRGTRILLFCPCNAVTAIFVSFRFLMWLCFLLLFRCGARYKMVCVGAASSPAQADQMKVKMPPVPTFPPTWVWSAAILVPALVYFWISDLTDFWEWFRKGVWLNHWDTKSLMCILIWSVSCWAGVRPIASVDGNGSFKESKM